METLEERNKREQREQIQQDILYIEDKTADCIAKETAIAKSMLLLVDDNAQT